MIESQILDSVVVHKLRGELSHRDAIDAKSFVLTNMDELPVTFSVLWDLRESNLLRTDESYESMVRALTAGGDARNDAQKRAFLVASDDHKVRVGRMLSAAKAPWPWALFSEFPQAAEWLKCKVS